MSDALTIAVSKGRILNECLPLLGAAGIEAVGDPHHSRRLVLETSEPGLSLVVVRATDVPTYVQYGAADLGITGKDVLLEHGGGGLYEPLDLKLATCRMVLARPRDWQSVSAPLRVATKYVRCTREHFARQGLQVEPIKLYGSMELAPLVGLADAIVDLVDSGATLAANGLVEVELLHRISARLIVNKASMKMKHTPVNTMIARLGEAVSEDMAEQT